MRAPSNNWIDGLPEAARKDVHAAMQRRAFEPGETIYRTGERTTIIYQIVSGTVQFSEVSVGGHDMLYAMTGQGGCFGMAPAVDGGPRAGTAIATEPTVLDCLTKSDFDQLRDRHPCIDRALAVWSFQHLRMFLQHRLQEGQFRGLRPRLAGQILFLLDSAGPHADGTRRHTLKLTQEALAASVGATRQAISKTMRHWSEANIVKYRYGLLRVLDVDLLRAAAEEDELR